MYKGTKCPFSLSTFELLNEIYLLVKNFKTSFGPQYRCFLMNLDPTGHPEVSYEQSSKAIALLFGGFAQSDSIDTIRQHFDGPASHTSGELVFQGVSRTSDSIPQPHRMVILKRKTVHLTDISSRLGQHRSLKSTPLVMSCVLFIVALCVRPG